MKFKESNKQKFYMRNVYINQIMKPQIQNNLNYAYFENSAGIPEYCNNKNISQNQKNIFFNNKPMKTLYQNCYPNQAKVNKVKKGTFSHQKNNKENENNFYENQIDELNEENLFRRNTNNKMSMIDNHINERSFSENKTKNFNKTYTFLKKKEKNNNDLSYLRVNPSNKNTKLIKHVSKNKEINDNNINTNNNNNKIYPNQIRESTYRASNNENISSRNTNSNSSLKSAINSKKSWYDERNKKQNFMTGKSTYFSEFNKNSINQLNKIVNENNACTTSPNSNNNSKINENINIKYANKNFSGKPLIKSYKNFEQYISCYKSVDKNQTRNYNNNIKYKNYMNNCNYNSPMRQSNEYKNCENISTLNSPSVPSYSSIIEDNNINNSKNYVWIKKNIKNNKLSSNIDKNYQYNYYKKPNINKDILINQNLINFANDITNINPYLYNTEIIYPQFINKENKIYIEKDIFEQSATIIQAAFRGYIIKRKFDIFYNNYKYYYGKGLEILELIINYFFKKSINIIEEKQKFFNYLISLRKSKRFNKNRNKNKNKISQKPKSYKNFKMFNAPFSPTTKSGLGINKFYQDLFLHKEIGERFNIIKQNNKEKELELKYKEKLDGINLKMNKLVKENNILKDINQKNIIKESKFREMSKDNKKKDDIINIITNDNKTLARKLKIIQDKFNKLQIQNQDYINYNSENEILSNNININKYHEIDLFEEYRNLYLSFLIHKNNEKYYISVLRKYLYKFRDNVYNINKTNEILKEQKLKNIINTTKNKESLHLYQNFIKFNYKGKICEKDTENKNNIIKYKLLNIFKNKEKSYKYNLRTYFHKFYYKGIIANTKEKGGNIINIKKENYKKICKLLLLIQKGKEKYLNNIKREYFIKWHLYTKVLALKGLINDRRKKKKLKQKLKKKNENEANNKYLNNNNILHFGKSNIYILNKNKEKELLISLDEKNQNLLTNNENINNDNKIDNVIKATEKLGEIFYKAAKKHKLLDNTYESKEKSKNEIKENNNNKDNNNDIEEDEDSGDSFGL